MYSLKIEYIILMKLKIQCIYKLDNYIEYWFIQSFKKIMIHVDG
jgi:hypothetical protein